jgi:hypothetical protein
MITENTKYALRVANPRAADRAAGGSPPEGRIVMTPLRPSNYCPINFRHPKILGFCRLFV